jgi:protein-S-isoprenylcysteine O-methyltransferase Ste14
LLLRALLWLKQAIDVFKISGVKMEKFVAQHRIVISRWCFGLVIALIFFTSPIWANMGLFDLTLKAIGFVMIVVAAFGRLWSSVFICGFKTKRVIQHGPYSMTRNPLYVFSFIGAVGFGFASASLLITAVIIAIYVLIYAKTVASEESKLEEALGVKYLQYKANTPRFIPDFTLYKNVNEYTINIQPFQRAFTDAIWFFLGFAGLQLIKILHQEAIFPVLFKVP